MTNAQILDIFLEVVQKGGRLALSRQKSAVTVSDSGGGDLTTDSDQRVQDMVTSDLIAAMPGVEILSEEGEKRNRIESAPRFILDPVDGSVDYSRGGDSWGVTAAYSSGTDIEVGMVYQPRKELLAWAVRGEGCWLQYRADAPQRVRLSDRPYEVGKEMIYLPFTSDFSDEVIEKVQPQIVKQMRFVHNCICNTGSIMLMLTDYLDGMVAWAKLWDFAAGTLMIEEAGGYVGDFWGQPMDLNLVVPQRVMLARSREMYDALLPYTSKWPKEGDLRK